MIVKTFVLSGTLLALIGLGNFCLGWTLSYQFLQLPFFDHPYLLDFSLTPYRDGASGFAMNPNVLGLFLAMILPLTAWWLTQSEKKGWLFFAWTLQMLCLLLTFSRAAWVGGLGSLSLVLVREYKRAFFRPSVWFIVIAATVSILLLTNQLQPIFEQMMTLGDLTYRTNQIRLQLWLSGWAMLKDHFLTGIGILHFELLYPTYQLDRSFPAAHLHQMYLQILVESGLVVGSCFFIFLCLVFRPFLYFFSFPPMIQAIQLSLIIFLIASCFDYTVVDTRIGIFISTVFTFWLYYTKKEWHTQNL